MNGGNSTAGSTNPWLIARWSAAVIMLIIPLVAMQFGDSVVWGAEDFIVAGVLIFGSLGAYELVTRVGRSTAYRTGLAVGIGAIFLMLWVNGAVGITDGDADGLYPIAAALGVVGALVAQFRARGMALAMMATAVAVALIGIVALVSNMVPEFNSAFEVLGITAFFVLLFSGSALLFREAGTVPADEEAAG